MHGTFLKHKPVAAIAMPFVFALAFILSLGLSAPPAFAASPSEQFISDNVQKGIAILNNTSLSKDQRRSQVRDLLLSITNLKWFADYSLGQYRRTATPADLAAFEGAFKDYALAIYQPYFNKYSGQTLQVPGSYSDPPDRTVVKTLMINPNKSGSKPYGLNFKVLNEGGRLAIIDLQDQDSGVWIGETMRDQITSQLGQNNGAFAPVIKAVRNKTEQLNK